MDIRIVKTPINIEELKNIAKDQFGDFVKAVIDIENKILAIGGELHADEETLLSENGSKRENTWGINIYPEQPDNDWIEFDSMINLKPHLGNRSRGVEDTRIQEKIKLIVSELIKR